MAAVSRRCEERLQLWRQGRICVVQHAHLNRSHLVPGVLPGSREAELLEWPVLAQRVLLDARGVDRVLRRMSAELSTHATYHKSARDHSEFVTRTGKNGGLWCGYWCELKRQEKRRTPRIRAAHSHCRNVSIMLGLPATLKCTLASLRALALPDTSSMLDDLGALVATRVRAINALLQAPLRKLERDIDESCVKIIQRARSEEAARCAVVSDLEHSGGGDMREFTRTIQEIFENACDDDIRDARAERMLTNIFRRATLSTRAASGWILTL